MEQLNEINVKLTVGNPAPIFESERKQIFLNEIARRTVKDWNRDSYLCKDKCEDPNAEIPCGEAFDKAVQSCFISGFCYEGSHVRK